MKLAIEHENFGYAIASGKNTYDSIHYFAVGDPSSFRYSEATSSTFRTGSIDIFKYNKATDKHDFIYTLYKQFSTNDLLLLAADPTASNIVHTEVSTTVPSTSDKDILLDIDAYVSPQEDDYGHSLDLHKNWLIAGCRYFRRNVNIPAASYNTTTSGSSVDIYDLNKLVHNTVDSTVTASQFFYASITGSIVETDTGSFGYAVSMNDEWIAVGSDRVNTNKGAVYMFRKSLNKDEWYYYSTITGSDSVANDYFGSSLKLNKASGTLSSNVHYSGSMVVGTRKSSSSKVYYYEFITGSNAWVEKFVLTPDHKSPYNLQFSAISPIIPCANYLSDGFGKAVSMWGDIVVVGAPTDRWIYEYSGSHAYSQGAAYIFKRCSAPYHELGFKLIKKTHGSNATLKNNKLGHSVDVYKNRAVVGVPRASADGMISCYVQGKAVQYLENAQDDEDENYAVQGQYILFQENTSSLDWDLKNVYQIKRKKYHPPRSFGYSIAIKDDFIGVGAPTILSDINRNINIDTSSLSPSLSVNAETLDFGGKAYFYNVNNLKDSFHVGNVFYRNGVVVLNTTGSVFKDLFFNPVASNNYVYSIDFQSKQTIYEKQIVCTAEPGEFNVSTNPTSIQKITASFDINDNGHFDFQDLDVLLRYMQWKRTENLSTQNNNWSQSLVTSDDEISYYSYFSQGKYGTEKLYSSSFSNIDSQLSPILDFNQDNQIDINDMYILWKYYTKRLTQNNYDSYIIANSQRRLINDVLEYMDEKSGRGKLPTIDSNFLDYNTKIATDSTGSYLRPFVTTVGLYSGLDLVAIAKLGTPIKLTPYFPTNFVVKMDF
jgi:hypothetical protein